MTFERLDTIARSCAVAASRRAVLATIAGGVLALLSRADDGDSAVEAKRRKQKARKKKRRQRHCPSHRRCPTRCCRKGQTCQQDRCRRRQRPPEPVDTLVRRNLHALDPSGPELNSFARGVAAMRRRPASDRTSWSAQVQLHRDQGRHASVHFLAWHRMYLYWFERILRQASGDSSFALPYWDWSNPRHRVLPDRFLNPSSPLYEASRSDMANTGDEWIFDTSKAMATTAFEDTGSGPSFGGGAQGIHGVLERSPHDYIHNWVGGKMAELPEAPADPVFWIHHANIDRLWEKWLRLGGGRANPTSGPFVETTFTFYDEHGAEVRMTGRQILDTVGDLGYRYDDVEGSAGAGSSATSARPSVSTRKRSATVAGATAVGEGLSLGRRPVTVPIPIRDVATASFRAAKRGKSARTTLALEGVAGGGVAGVTHAVHVGAASDNPSPDARSFVGAIGLFGLQPWDHHGHGGATMRFDVTDAIAVAGDDRAVTVTLVPLSFTGSDSLPRGTWLTIERIVITVDDGRPSGARKSSRPRKKGQRPSDGRDLAKRHQRKASQRPGDTKRMMHRKRNRRLSPQSPARATAAQYAPGIPGGKVTAITLKPADGAARTANSHHAHH